MNLVLDELDLLLLKIYKFSGFNAVYNNNNGFIMLKNGFSAGSSKDLWIKCF